MRSWLGVVGKLYMGLKDRSIWSNIPVWSAEFSKEKISIKDHKKKWLFGRSSRGHRSKGGSISPPAESTTMSAYFGTGQGEDEQNQQAFAVAAAAATAAQAAIAAAQAAAAIVRLRASFYEDKSTEERAAIKIQSVFRSYLARRALRALKGLVRLQALVRGHAVRRQAAITLGCMQALVKVQALVRGRRVRTSEVGQMVQMQLWRRRQQKMRQPSRKSISLADHAQDIWKSYNRQPQEAGMKLGNSYKVSDSQADHWGWNWLDRWMAVRPWEKRNKELSSLNRIEDHAKIKEFKATWKKEDSDLVYQVDTLAPNQSTAAPQLHSPYNYPSPSRMLNMKVDQTQIKHMINQTQTTTNFTSHIRNLEDQGVVVPSGRSAAAAPTLAKNGAPPYPVFAKFDKSSAATISYSRDDENIFDFPLSIPNYMALTQSARAKIRPLTTPRERPGTPDRDPIKPTMKRLSFSRSNSPVKTHSTSQQAVRGVAGAHGSLSIPISNAEVEAALEHYNNIPSNPHLHHHYYIQRP
ncbi:hypothetical protein O6H91_13G000300 [Diphasiastrum complanatum]|uniref:Uncharacterized protein n=1 Tax=Diphasiastrum complanatum TaxID=34168 RepID=A0ACC2BRL3_DIPCM|nr:hypothetical protein O6H91_13G000300 [Diphasiastrum complanatum]